MCLKYMRAVLTAVCVGATLTACAVASSSPRPAPSGRKAVEVVVQNNNWMDMTIYVVRDGTRVRLGTVTTMTSSNFRLPRSLDAATTSFRLLADPVGSSETFVSDVVTVNPGERVQWRLENHLALSSFLVTGAN